jgi:hypothetical protein
MTECNIQPKSLVAQSIYALCYCYLSSNLVIYSPWLDWRWKRCSLPLRVLILGVSHWCENENALINVLWMVWVWKALPKKKDHMWVNHYMLVNQQQSIANQTILTSQPILFVSRNSGTKILVLDYSLSANRILLRNSSVHSWVRCNWSRWLEKRSTHFQWPPIFGKN